MPPASRVGRVKRTSPLFTDGSVISTATLESTPRSPAKSTRTRWRKSWRRGAAARAKHGGEGRGGDVRGGVVGGWGRGNKNLGSFLPMFFPPGSPPSSLQPV